MKSSLNILVWHVHGGWLDSFVRGRHVYLLPTDSDGNGGRGGRDWTNTVDVPETELSTRRVDVVVLQRTEELALTERLLGKRPGIDVPAIFVEHNTPTADVPNARHPLADQTEIPIAHVTYFNELFWDTGIAPKAVIEHGVVDHGDFFTGELPRAAAVINEPVRRWRSTGSDLLGGFSQVAPVDVFGMKAEGLAEKLGVPADRVVAAGDLAVPSLQAELGRRRAYVHPNRWTSLGLSLLEAMTAGMPAIALDSTDARRAVVPGTGTISTDVRDLHTALRHLVDDPSRARDQGAMAREWALEKFGLGRFLSDWDTMLDLARD